MELIINFKNYKQSKDVLQLAKLIEKYNPNAIVAVPATNIKEVSQKTKLQVYSQHVDYKEKGRGTGYLIAEEVKREGGVGTLLNHSEHRLKSPMLKKTMVTCKKHGLKVIIFAKDLREAKKVKLLRPDMIAYEDPDLVGSGKSIIDFRANTVKKFSKLFKHSNILPLCGAGIHSKRDIVEARRLKCKGVVISSAITDVDLKKAEKFLKEIGDV